MIMLTRRTDFCLCFVFCLWIGLAGTCPGWAADASSEGLKSYQRMLDSRSGHYGWKDIPPGSIAWEYHRTTRNHHPLIFAHFGKPSGDCVLFLGGVHGDELPTVYLMFKLAQYLQEHPEVVKDKCIVIAPLVNPDGFLAPAPTRVNANGVDLNRNFPTRDWKSDAHRRWVTHGRKNPRYYPGSRAASEQETLFQIALIRRFKPQKILSAHSPLNFFDYDGPSSDLNSFEKWMEKISREANHPLKKFGYYPGSLGNYAGHERNIFTLTLELPASDPTLGSRYFLKFQSAFLKFIDLPVAGTPPYTRLVRTDKP
jgi:murein peptide amidase A